MTKPRMVLGIETCGKSTGLALVDSGKAIAELVEDSSCSHNEVLMPLLDRLLKDAGVKISELAGIGVDIGPGMFTSLRVGVATAKGLAVAHRIPIVGLGSLWGLARTALPSLDGVLAVIDARKQQVYAALYLDGQTPFPPVVATPGELATEVDKALSGRISLVTAGDGVPLCFEFLSAARIEHEPSGVETPSPGVIAAEASERIAQAEVDPIASLEPLYLRRTDAELTREQKLNPKL
ncbi:tRNA (adenosine(37)-N6)-threonylcarbamoyltransferase complex dimerization subunit type 1 TsaB [candidate division WOR-3 bacterium]|nr:tRNA (adenosine(37)-N6)-threonylcarbamoyltransferase complex dimerization subunit type 1 TsaB [candidate division WOR-3 bacterium]